MTNTKNSKNLNPIELIGKGTERACYIHPGDTNKVIKVPHRTGQNQNRIEAIYYEHLKNRGADLSQVAKYYGWVNIDGQQGLIFERVVNYDGKPSPTLSKVVFDRLLKKKPIWHLLEALQQYLVNNRIIFADISEDNLLCQEYAKDEYRLVIIDGLGARKSGLKFFLQRHCTPYIDHTARYQWKKMELRLRRLFALRKSQSQTLKEALDNSIINKKDLSIPLNRFHQRLQEEKIVLPYASLKHIIFRKTKKGNLKLIAPGKLKDYHLGSQRLLLRYCRPYTRYKLKNQWKVINKKIDRILQKNKN